MLRCLRKTGICATRASEVKLRQVLRYFCADLTAAQGAELGGLNRKTVLRLYTLFRRRIALLATDECPFAGEVEVDESYFGAHRVRGRRGRGAGRKTPVFGILERGGRVHTQIVEKLFESNAPGHNPRQNPPRRKHPFRRLGRLRRAGRGGLRQASPHPPS